MSDTCYADALSAKEAINNLEKEINELLSKYSASLSTEDCCDRLFLSTFYTNTEGRRVTLSRSI